MITRAVIFDLGHTLWDIGDSGDALTRAYAAMRETLCARLGHDAVPEAPALQQAVTDALRASAETYFMQSTELRQPPTHTWVAVGCRAAGLDLPDALAREVTPPLFATEVDRLICHEGTREAVEDLAARGYAIGCVTNTLADAATIWLMLERHGFARVMSSVVVSSEEGWRKPHASLFEKAMRELETMPEDAVFVGDSPWHDIGGAKAAGMHAVLTTQYVTRSYDGFEPPPDAVISHARDLPEVLRRLGL